MPDISDIATISAMMERILQSWRARGSRCAADVSPCRTGPDFLAAGRDLQAEHRIEQARMPR